MGGGPSAGWWRGRLHQIRESCEKPGGNFRMAHDEACPARSAIVSIAEFTCRRLQRPPRVTLPRNEDDQRTSLHIVCKETVIGCNAPIGKRSPPKHGTRRQRHPNQPALIFQRDPAFHPDFIRDGDELKMKFVHRQILIGTSPRSRNIDLIQVFSR